ncbi:MAG: hypothetical protein ABSG43_26510 [Solirubrobacteraceae bacterium]|jgi:hypothetical protein
MSSSAPGEGATKSDLDPDRDGRPQSYQDWRDRTHLPRLIYRYAKEGSKPHERDLRQAFIIGRYAHALESWFKRSRRHRNFFYVLTVGIASLGVISSGLVAATSGHRSTAINIC